MLLITVQAAVLGTRGMDPPLVATTRAMRQITWASLTYKGEWRVFPADMPTLLATTKNWNPVDGWGRPFVGHSTTAAFVAVSFGEDGVPGGIGLAEDITLAGYGMFTPEPKSREITLSSWWSVKGSLVGLLVAVTAGLGVGWVVFTDTRKPLRSGQVLTAVLGLGIVAWMAFNFAALIAGVLAYGKH